MSSAGVSSNIHWTQGVCNNFKLRINNYELRGMTITVPFGSMMSVGFKIPS
jgi:hypothetical protein